MGLPEKVALIIVCITIKQIIFTSCSSGEKAPSKNYSHRVKQKQNIDSATHTPIVITLRPRVRNANVKNKPNPERKNEGLRKNFNFPDMENPSASTPRPPFYLQETNILQRNPVQRSAEYPTLTTVQYAISNKNDIYKLNPNSKLTQTKTKKKPGVTITLPEFGTTPKPYCFRDGDFPDVEYPLSAKDIWRPNYWKPLPGGPTNDLTQNVPGDIYKSESIAKKNDGSLNRVRINPIPNSQSKKRDSNNNNVLPASITKKNKKTVNFKQQGTAKRDPGQNELIKIEIHTSTPRIQTTKAMKKDNPNSKYTTPASAQSENIESTIPNVLTPFTTLYFDTTPSYVDSKSSLRDERESITPSPKINVRKKKTKKKNSKSKQSKHITLNNDDTAFIATSSSSDAYENQIDSLLLTESSFAQCPVTPLPEEHCLTTIQQESEGNITKADSYTHISNEPDTRAITPPCHSSDINPTSTSQIETHNDYKTPISIDNKVASMSDAINTIVSDNKDNKASCFEDNVINCHKSVTRDNRTNDSLSCRVDVIDLPSLDEEFTTDVFPDFDENILGVSSTLSPLALSTVDEAWANSEVIDPYKSLSYPDELEQYYILVP